MMASKWSQIEIGEVGQVFDGPHATPKKQEHGPVFLGISSLDNGKLDLCKSERLSEKDFAKWTKRVTPQKDDIVFSYETRLGEAAIIPEGLRCCLGRRMALVRLNQDRIIPRFFLYQYLSPEYQQFIQSRIVDGSTVNRIHLKEFPKFKISLPPLETQKAIAHILGTLDDKIDLNRRMNETLEAMAQALFKSWFVDFDPVKAKMEGRQPEGMDAETAALFPDKLVESELGLIPEGWEAKQLKKACSYLKRGLQPKYLDCGGVRVINQRCIRSHWIDYTQSRLHDSKIRKITGRELQPGDVVVNSTGVGTLGRVAQVYQLHQATVADTHITIMRPKNELLLAEYFGNWAIHNETKFESMGHGSTGQTELRRAELMELTLLVPSMKVQTAFNEVTSIFAKKRVENYNTIGTLTEARDILLPQLITGKLSVAEIEKQLESVL